MSKKLSGAQRRKLNKESELARETLLSKVPKLTNFFNTSSSTPVPEAVTTKGSLIPLPNASSYGHLDITALLIKFSTVANATDKWGFTPLHEAAQKGKTQLCALLLARGSDPFLKKQEGQAPVDLASADDVRCLLQDAMASQQVVPTTAASSSLSTAPPQNFSPAILSNFSI
ncbi:hypothetical protein RN001_006685 [Aquatica leii]|uniref:Uncharacterized protein n=1 Tax=Aquatica leii TaxID=1421715 RepID=A0AAN7SBK6_9COLE|nr:hypothetical protein RN001_006685 [Aquatica leii]